MTTPFKLGIYRVIGGSETLVQETLIDGSRLSDGCHSILITPSASFNHTSDPNENYTLLARLDKDNQVAETNESNNTATLNYGLFLSPNGTVHAHGSSGSDEVKLFLTNGALTAQIFPVNQQAVGTVYSGVTVPEVRVRAQIGNDTINRAAIAMLMSVWGGEGSDAYTMDGVGRTNIYEALDADIDTLVLSGGSAQGYLYANGAQLLKATSTGAVQLKLSSAGSLPALTPVVERVAVTGGGDVTIEQFAEGTGTVPAGTSFRNTSGTTTFSANSGNTTTFAMDVQANGGELVFNATQNLDDLIVGASGLARIAQNGSRVLVVNTLSITSGGTLDVIDNDLIIRTMTAGAANIIHQQVENWIISGMNGLDGSLITRWNGTGIISSIARTSNVSTGFDLVGVGVIRNSDLNTTTGLPNGHYTSFDGQTVQQTFVLVKYTYIGDANLSGAVTFDDYVGMDNASSGLIPNLGWATGDINFNDVINFDDYSKVDQAFYFQGAPL